MPLHVSYIIFHTPQGNNTDIRNMRFLKICMEDNNMFFPTMTR